MMMRLADLSIELVDRIVVVRIVGEIDLSNAGELGSVISDRVTNEMLGLALDVTNLEYIDSAGIQLVFELRVQLKNRGQEMRLVVPAGATIAKTLQIVDIPRIVGVSESTQQAIDSIAAAVPHPS